jgi:hypothetical protein
LSTVGKEHLDCDPGNFSIDVDTLDVASIELTDKLRREIGLAGWVIGGAEEMVKGERYIGSFKHGAVLGENVISKSKTFAHFADGESQTLCLSVGDFGSGENALETGEIESKWNISLAISW